MKNPLVSIIIPTYNREGIVVKAINSALNQTYQNIEVIVVDDGSTDNTRSTITRIQDKRVRYVYKLNGGCASALNIGIQHSKGELIAWLSSDDWYDFEENNIIEKAVETHKNHPNVGMTYVDYTINEPTRISVFNAFSDPDRMKCVEKLLNTCYICGSGMVIKREVFYTIGFFNENFRYGQDYEFYFRVLTMFDIKKIEYVNKPLLNYYYSPNHECLGKPITQGVHGNESDTVTERFKLMFDRDRKTVCAMLCVKNESAIIEQCLNDLSMYVDAIVILDDGSYDNTVELAKKWHKVKFIHCQKDKGDKRTEGQDRQMLLNLAYNTKTDYFLFIDADEVFEDRFKTEIFKQMNTSIKLWFYQEVNFWRSTVYHRIDELYDKGWFGRLFKATPGLKYQTIDEHCGGIPHNIPETAMWFDNGHWQKKSHIRVKHYGFSTENRILLKFRSLWKREKNRLTLAQRHNMYDRLLDESTLVVKKYYEKPYWVIKEQPLKEEIVYGDEFGRSKRMMAELDDVKNGRGEYG